MSRVPRGFTLLEVAVAVAIAGLLSLVVLSCLVTGFNFALEAEEYEGLSLGLRAAADRMTGTARQAKGHKIYGDYALYQAGSPMTGGTSGRCLRLLLPTETHVFWLDPDTLELKSLVEGTGAAPVVARGVTEFQARCVDSSQVLLRLEAATSSASDISSRIFYETTVHLRNYDGSSDSCCRPWPWRPA